MDPRSVNFAARRNLGFFLTRGKDDETNREEHDFFAVVSRKCTDLLRERRIRPSNVLTDLTKVDALLSQVAELVKTEATRRGYEDLQTEGGSRAYASLLVTASLSRYANLMDKRGEEGTRVRSKQND
jgi:hypothetical protein